MADAATWGREPSGDAVEIVLVRHGRTAWNAERRFLGRTDIGLDAVGREEVRGLAPLAAGLDAVYCSPLSRALETARVLDPQPVCVDDLMELWQGDLEGLSGEEAMRRHPDFFRAFQEDPEHVVVPGGESLGACRDRAWRALTALVAEHAPGQRIAVVSHQMVIAALVATVRESPLAAWRRHGVRNAACSVLGLRAGRWSVVVEDWRPEGLDPAPATGEAR